jgi:SRSO17 transposase
MIPIVFCPSLEPCARVNAAAESNWSLRKYLSIFDGVEWRNSDYSLRRLARLTKCRWKIEQDYQPLKEELGLDHYDGRSWQGWHQ